MQAALRIVDAEGLDGLTMRRLGTELDVDPMTIYRYIDGKDELLDLLIGRVRSKMQVAEPLPPDVGAVLESVFVEYRRVLLAHPNVIPLATRRTNMSRPTGLEALVDAGMPVEDAVALYQSLLAFTVGFSSLGNPTIAKDWDRFPAPLAERLHHWDDDTYRRTLRTILSGYGLLNEEEAEN